MTLIDAVKSGKPFRHKSWHHKQAWTHAQSTSHPITLEEAISDDWIIQQKETFSREDVERGIEMAIRLASYCPHRDLKTTNTFKEAMKAAENSEPCERCDLDKCECK